MKQEVQTNTRFLTQISAYLIIGFERFLSELEDAEDGTRWFTGEGHLECTWAIIEAVFDNLELPVNEDGCFEFPTCQLLYQICEYDFKLWLSSAYDYSEPPPTAKEIREFICKTAEKIHLENLARNSL